MDSSPEKADEEREPATTAVKTSGKLDLFTQTLFSYHKASLIVSTVTAIILPVTDTFVHVTGFPISLRTCCPASRTFVP